MRSSPSLWLVTLVGALAVTGCAPEREPLPLRRLDPGMSEAQVLRILGEPDAVAVRGLAKYLRYDDLEDGEEGPYIVEIRAGHVHTTGRADKYGTLETLFPPADLGPGVER